MKNSTHKLIQQRPNYLQSKGSLSEESWIIKQLFGSKHWCTKWVSALCSSDTRFLKHISEQRHDYIHYLCIVKLGIEMNSDSILTIYSDAYKIRNTTKINMLRSLFSSCPKGLLKALPKLGKKALPRGAYKNLISALTNTAKSKIIHHNEKLHPKTLELLEWWPEELPVCPGVANIKTSERVELFKYMFNCVKAVNTASDKELLYKDLSRAKNYNDIIKWFNKCLENIIFPDPPWIGNSLLQPITSAKKLNNAARIFNNCLSDLACYVRRGRNYFYIYTGQPQAIIKLFMDPYLGWSVEEINGKKNRKISRGSRAIILNEFALNAIHKQPESTFELFNSECNEWDDD